MTTTMQPRGHTQTARERQQIEDKMEEMLRNLCTTQQAAETLGVTQQHIRHLIDDGRIAAVHLGHRYWVVYRPSITKYKKRKSPRGRPPSRIRT